MYSLRCRLFIVLFSSAAEVSPTNLGSQNFTLNISLRVDSDPSPTDSIRTLSLISFFSVVYLAVFFSGTHMFGTNSSDHVQPCTFSVSSTANTISSFCYGYDTKEGSLLYPNRGFVPVEGLTGWLHVSLLSYVTHTL